MIEKYFKIFAEAMTFLGDNYSCVTMELKEPAWEEEKGLTSILGGGDWDWMGVEKTGRRGGAERRICI